MHEWRLSKFLVQSEKMWKADIVKNMISQASFSAKIVMRFINSGPVCIYTYTMTTDGRSSPGPVFKNAQNNRYAMNPLFAYHTIRGCFFRKTQNARVSYANI